METSSPNVEYIAPVPISVAKNEVWFKIKNTLLVFRKNKEDFKMYVVNPPQIIGVYKLSGACESLIVEGADICHLVNTITSSWEEYIEQLEITLRAEASALVDYKTVPRMPSEWEILISSLADQILSKKTIKNFIIRDGNREIVLGLYCYEDGYYRECEESLRHEIETYVKQSRLLEDRMTSGLVGEVIKKIERKTLEDYRPATKCLLFKDKVLCWDLFMQTKDLEKSLLDPRPDLVVTHRIPWRINVDLYKKHRPGLLKFMPPQTTSDIIELFKALSPKSFKAFLDWTKYPGEQEQDAYPRIVLLLEIIGYTLYPHDYPLHKAILLVGEGSNGKTTYLNLVEKILSRQNVASVNLTQLDPRTDRFASSDLYGKLANISSEPIKTAYFDATLFKRLTGEDLIRFERKHRDAFYGHNYAKMIFSANELPRVTEDTYAFWRRWIVLEFPNRFPPDPEYFDRTFTPEEIEGIIICALHAFRLVLERHEFTSQGARDPREEWMNRSNPAYRVINKMIQEDYIVLSPDRYVVKKDLYELYKRYALKLQEEGEDVEVLDQREFTKTITRFFPIRTGDRRISGKTKHVYIGIGIKNYDKARELVGELETPPLDLSSFEK